MSFWSNPSVEPKRQHRWVFSLSNHFSTGWMVKSVTKPTADVNIAEANYFGHKYKYPGIVEWKDIEVTLTDPVSPDSVTELAKVLRESGYNPPLSAPTRGGVETPSKLKSGNTLGQIFIRQVDANGGIIEEWTLTNPIIKSVDFGGTLDYSQDGLIEVKMSIAYDWAQLSKGANGTKVWTAGTR